jgi:hypothetical protein
VSSPLPYLFLLLLLLIPSNGLQQFDGLPLSHWIEFAALAFLLPFLFFRSLRQGAAELFSKVRFFLPLFYAAGAIVFILKVGLWVFGGRDGFIGCYYSPAPWAPNYPGAGVFAGCERSYEDLFHRSGGTRIDRSISFGPDSWNLTFLNSLRYDYPQSVSDSIPRSRVPVTAEWTAFIALEQPTRVIVRYAGQGHLAVGTQMVAIPPSYGQVNEIAADLPAGKQNFLLQYSFDDGSRNGQAEESWGPAAQLHVMLAGPSGEQPLHAMPPGLSWTVAAGGADILLVLLLLVLLVSFLAGIRQDKWLVLFFIAFLAICYFLPLSERVRGLGATAGLMGFWLWYCLRKPVQPITVYSVILCFSLFNNLLLLPDPSRVVLRSAQDDPLNYESGAYSVLSSGSLEGGEKVFVYQPMFRYIKFGEHAIFGDGMTFPATMQLAVFLGGAFFLGEKILRKGISRPKRLLLAAIGAAIVFLGGYYVSIVIRAGLSEYTTWSLLLWALPLLYLDDKATACLMGLAALAFSFTIRTDQLPAILWVAFWALNSLRKKNKWAFAFGSILLVCIFLLPLMHNLYYGHQFVLATTSGNFAINLPVPPATWLAVFRGDSAAAAAIQGQLKQMFLLTNVSLSTRLTLTAMAALFVVWLGIIGYSIVRRRFSDLALLAIPLFYLAPHLFFAIIVYYPRLIFIAYLAMGAAAAVWLARGPSTAAIREEAT